MIITGIFENFLPLNRLHYAATNAGKELCLAAETTVIPWFMRKSARRDRIIHVDYPIDTRRVMSYSGVLWRTSPITGVMTAPAASPTHQAPFWPTCLTCL